jgi:hypothetical protein
MSNTLVKIYDDFSAAQNARDQLLASGFPPSSVQLSARDDEAGPVEGNFTVGNGRDQGGQTSGWFGPKDGSSDPYTRDFANVVQRGIYMLTVDASDDDESARANDIMNRAGPGDADRMNNHGSTH